MVLGDSLQVMASLAEREGLRGKVQCIYIDPPYGIKFNSNFQWSTTSRDVKDGKVDHIPREAEQVKAFRDTWRDGVHSYLTYLQDRLTVARDLLAESGSVFIQIGDENVHRVRAVADEVLGSDNFVATIGFRTHSPLGVKLLPHSFDYLIWYARSIDVIKFRRLFVEKQLGKDSPFTMVQMPDGLRSRMKDGRSLTKKTVNGRVFRLSTLSSSGYTPSCTFPFEFENKTYSLRQRKSWRTHFEGMKALARARRLYPTGTYLNFIQFFDDFSVMPINNNWDDVYTQLSKNYVVETSPTVIQRCILMTTDPGDLVLDPTCGSGTTAYVAEQWGRRWITIDTSRVALALARARIMGARYPYYLLADSREGQEKEAEIERKAPSVAPRYGDVRQGFVYQRVPHITLRAIANNAEIDVIWEEFQERLEPLREDLNNALGTSWEEWEVPREADENWQVEVRELHAAWWEQRIARQQEIDASIAAKADYEYLYDKPYEDKNKVRVAGPFTVESISPHRTLAVDENDEFIDTVGETPGGYDFAAIILDNLRTAGVQQAHKEDRISFTYLEPCPGHFVCAEGRYYEGGEETGIQRRAAIFIGPEFGTVSRPDLVAAAREAADGAFDVLIACAFNYEAHTTEFERLGKIPVLKARMNADLHMAADLANTGKGNLFVIFGEPDVELLAAENDQVQVRVNGVDVFHPNTGEVRSDGPDGIACWFVDTDYNEESFFVRHAYFLGAGDPYKSLKTTLKAEIDTEAWETLHSDTSRPFPKPSSGRIAVKVINHLGDEVMKIFRVDD